MARAGALQISEPTPPRRIVVDRPFDFVIHEVTTGAPVFIGQVVDPTLTGPPIRGNSAKFGESVTL